MRFTVSPTIVVTIAFAAPSFAGIERQVPGKDRKDGRLSRSQLLVHPAHLPKLQDAKYRVLDHGAGHGQGAQDVLPDGGPGCVHALCSCVIFFHTLRHRIPCLFGCVGVVLIPYQMCNSTQSYRVVMVAEW